MVPATRQAERGKSKDARRGTAELREVKSAPPPILLDSSRTVGDPAMPEPSAVSSESSFLAAVRQLASPIEQLHRALHPDPHAVSRLTTAQALNDICTLAKLCSTHVTAVSLALKPRADFTSAEQMCFKWSEALQRLLVLVSLWVGGQGVWDKEVRWATLALVESFQALQNTLLNTPTNRQAVLQATGLVWSAVSGLTEHCSATSQAAYAKAFKNTQDTISDAHAELRDLIDSGASDSDSPEAHPPPPLDEEEETDELDNILNSLAPTAPLAEKEEERIKGLSVLIRLARLLFKRVAAFTLASSSDDQQLERLWKNGEELSEMVDDIVMAAQPEQDLDELKRLLRSLKEACERLANHPAEQEELSDALQSLKVGETKKASTDEERKWRSMAVAQIQKAADQILAI